MKKFFLFAAFAGMLMLSYASVQAQSCQADFQYTNNPAGFSFTDSSTTTSGTINSWLWDFGDGNTSTLQNPNHFYNLPGTFLVCLTISTTNACTSTFCDTVTVGNVGPTCNAGMAVALAGSTATFTASGTGSGTPVSWDWDFGDGNTATTASPSTSHNYTGGGSGSYNACLTITYSDSCIASTCQNVVIGGSSNNCQAGYYYYPDTSTAYSIIVVNNSIGAGLTCSWDFGDGNTSTGCFPSHTYSGPGLYVVCLTVTSGPLCTSTYCDSIQVVSKVNAPFSINVIPETPTSVEDPLTSGLEIGMYPNPASDVVNFTTDLGTVADVEIDLFNLQGQQVRHFSENGLSVGGHSFRIQTADLPAGIYMARVRAGEEVVTKKLLLNK